MRYASLVQCYEAVEAATGRLEKAVIIQDFLRHVAEGQLAEIIPLLQGKIFPEYDERKVGVAARLVLKALSVATGYTTIKVELYWKKTGDLGKTAELLIAKKYQATLFSTSLTVHKVFSNLRKLTEMTGEGTVDNKIKLIAELLTSAEPSEAKYVVRSLLQELRVGIGEGTLRDAIVLAYLLKTAPSYDKDSNSIVMQEDQATYTSYVLAVQHALDLTNDFVVVAETAMKGVRALHKLSMQPGVPVKVMLAQKVNNLQEGFERVKTPAAIEYKYDGFRIQVHKADKIRLFTRRLEDVTRQFPDVVEAVKQAVFADSYVLDGEVVGVKDGRYMPFQYISQRIKRKHDVAQLVQQLPVELNLFDILYLNGKTLIHEPFRNRRKVLSGVLRETKFCKLARQIITGKQVEAESFYKESLAAGNEGVMLKNLGGVYRPGSRVGFMVKLKPVMETLDLVIVGAEWGEGKRGKWLSSFVLACYDSSIDRFVTVGKVGTGIKELEQEDKVTFQQLTDLLRPLILSEQGKEVRVKPEVVLEITYEEIQSSPTYQSGFALRFPRVLRLRSDRSAKEISELSFVQQLFEQQQKHS